MVQMRNVIIALHMHWDIALNGCECMVGKSTLRLVFDWVGRLNETTSNRVAWLIEMVRKICVRYQQVGIDPPSGERPANYDQTYSPTVKGRKSVWVCEARGETAKIRYPQKGAWILNIK